MTNIAILTFQSSNNYGALLQCYALSKTIESLGCKVSIINLQKEYIKDFSHLDFKIKQKTLVKNYLTNTIFQREFAVFRKKYLSDKFTKSIKRLEGLKTLSDKFDSIVVGSDQVWRQAYTKKTLSSFYLDFASESTKKIAYAASFGLDYFEGDIEVEKKVNKLIHKFNAVSVREDTGVEICKNLFNVDATHVLDPVFLLSSTAYEKLIAEKEEESTSKYLAFYLLNPDGFKEQLIAKVLKKYGIDHKINIYTNDQFNFKRPTFSIRKYKFRSFSSWLATIKNADFIVTDSFHGLAFSIIFNKQFICIANELRGASRMKSVLKLLRLEDRLVFEGQTDYDLSSLNEINYDLVNEKLDLEKEKSLTYLKNALKSES